MSEQLLLFHLRKNVVQQDSCWKCDKYIHDFIMYLWILSM